MQIHSSADTIAARLIQTSPMGTEFVERDELFAEVQAFFFVRHQDYNEVEAAILEWSVEAILSDMDIAIV